jgi:hypothetical protein
MQDNFPDLENTCIGRAELSKRSKPLPLPYRFLSLIQNVRTQTLTSRQDWACEASFQIYPLYAAILLYCIDTLILDPNVLRDSILVRLEMTPYECYVRLLSPDTKLIPLHPNPNRTLSEPSLLTHVSSPHPRYMFKPLCGGWCTVNCGR